MALYIAICDDHVADRKQFERLFDREHSKREAEGKTIYVDSFGSCNALMKTPYRYDLFLIDITSDPDYNGIGLARAIIDLGIEATIVMCSDTIDYEEEPDRPEGLLYMKKPLYKQDITDLVDMVEKKSEKKIPLIEIRCKGNTVFTPYINFSYAINRDKYFQTEVHLADGRVLICTENMAQFSQMLLAYECMLPCKKDFVNLNCVKELHPGSLITEDGQKFRFSLLKYSKAKDYLKKGKIKIEEGNS
ncbi:MAG: hypothetical protein K5931_11155 [Lachnospiraceae bacterium]|nr:hypothetical protein [Lachnospiraceae bacterium]